MPRIASVLESTVIAPVQASLTAFVNMMAKMWSNLANVINGGISFGNGTTTDNIAGQWVTFVTPATPGTNFTVNHNLGRLPVGFLVASKGAACDVYLGTTAATTTQITLKASAATVSVTIFVI